MPDKSSSTVTRRRDPALRRMIPLTPLRHFYHRLRDFVSDSFHPQAARECERRPSCVQDLVAASLEHFGLYDNRDEGFRPAPGGLTEDRAASQHEANRLLGLIVKGRCVVPSCPRLEFEFVDYEVSPIRTTRSEFENGRPATDSGKGGIDVLLANRLDRLPGVGEAKASTDRNPFLGFIQALTYAVELSTVPQRARLDRFYPGRFAWPESGPFIDITLLLARYPDDAKHAEFLGVIDRITCKVLVPGSPFGTVVRRVACLKSEMTDPGEASFGVAFVHPVQIIPPT